MIRSPRTLARVVLFGAFGIGLVACGSQDHSGPNASGKRVTPRPDIVWQTLGADQLGGAGAVKALGDQYLESYFVMFPSRATASGLYDHDASLEDFSRERLSDWFSFAESILTALPRGVLEDCADSHASLACRSAEIDADLLRRKIELHLLDWQERGAPHQNPSLWTQIASSSTVYLLVRHDRPSSVRLAAVSNRLGQIPRLMKQASDLLSDGDPAQRTELHSRLAAGQARSLAGFYRERLIAAAGLAEDTDAPLRVELEAAGREAAAALESFADLADRLASNATGSPILGAALYERRFALYTGIEATPSEVLAIAESALVEQLGEADRWAQKLWPALFEEPAPANAHDRVRALFLRIGDDHAESVDAFVADYRELVTKAEAFVKANEVVSTPDPLTLITDRSPSFFSGASVGGVYSTGPFAPQANTLLFLPTPPDSFSAEQQSAFFRDFNHHFNVMITPHELMPGHYLQLKWAALHPSKIRAMFGDGVTIEGWGTFAERLMLDLGWGDELAYAAHLKKRMENTARTIVDIRVHTMGMEQDEVERFVVEEALQEEQFARNMRRRTLTTAPQLVTYFVGSREIEKTFKQFLELKGVEDVTQLGAGAVREFTDGVMAMGPVPLSRWGELQRLMAVR